MGQNQDLLAVVSHLDVGVRMGPFLQDFRKSANSRKWHSLSGCFPEPGAFISVSGTETGGWRKRFSGAFPILPVLCDLGGGVWAALRCVALSLFTVHKMGASVCVFPSWLQFLLHLSLQELGQNCYLLKSSQAGGLWCEGTFFFFFCCISVNVFCLLSWSDPR